MSLGGIGIWVLVVIVCCILIRQMFRRELADNWQNDDSSPQDPSMDRGWP